MVFLLAILACLFATVRFYIKTSYFRENITYLVIVSEITRLAFSYRVVELICVLTVPSILVPSELSIARTTHVFGIVFSILMGALCYLHRLNLSACVIIR